eukprot:405005-Prymnesium_polylepis.1
MRSASSTPRRDFGASMRPSPEQRPMTAEPRAHKAAAADWRLYDAPKGVVSSTGVDAEGSSTALQDVQEQLSARSTQLAVAKQEIARLRARTGAQTASRMYVELDQTRHGLADTAHELGSVRAKLVSTRERHKAQLEARN